MELLPSTTGIKADRSPAEEQVKKQPEQQLEIISNMANSKFPEKAPSTDIPSITIQAPSPPKLGEEHNQHDDSSSGKSKLKNPSTTLSNPLPWSQSSPTLNKLWEPEGQFQVSNPDPKPAEPVLRKSSLQPLSRSLSRSLTRRLSMPFIAVYTAAKELDKPRLLSHTAPPRPDTSSERTSSPPLPTTTLKHKPKKLTKSASSNLLRESSLSPGSSSSVAPNSRPQTRDCSPANRTSFIETASSGISGTSILPPPGNDPHTSDSSGQDRGRLLNRMSFRPLFRGASQEPGTPEQGTPGPVSWVLGGPNVVEYDLDPLTSGERVSPPPPRGGQILMITDITRFLSSGMIWRMSMYIYFEQVALPRSRSLLAF